MKITTLAMALALSGCQLIADIEDLELTAPPGGSTGSSSMPPCDIPEGALLFEERFEDTDFASRGWYDGPGALLSSDAAPGSEHAFQCDLAAGDAICTGGRPARRKIPPTPSLYLRFYLRMDALWQGNFNVWSLLTNYEDDYKGPGHTRLTTSVLVDEGRAMLTLADGENVDPNCVKQTDGTVVGCNGDFESYPFDENRSVCACNGLLGEVDAYECDSGQDGTWWSWRGWSAEAFTAAAGPGHKAEWHLVEVYFEMNGFEDGKGVPDGKLRWLQDGEPIVCSDRILFRTGARSDMLFSQLLGMMYLGQTAAQSQTLWVDDLVVATGRP